MAQYRVLNRAFIGGRLVAMGDIVDLDPSQVSARDTHLEPIDAPASDEPKVLHEIPTADPVEEPEEPKETEVLGSETSHPVDPPVFIPFPGPPSSPRMSPSTVIIPPIADPIPREDPPVISSPVEPEAPASSSILPGHIAYVTGEPTLIPASTAAPAASDPQPPETEHP